MFGIAVAGHRTLWQWVALAVQALMFTVLPCTAYADDGASPFDCSRVHCGVPTDKPYPHLVVGTISAIATPEQAGAIFEHLRKLGWWQSLPDDKKAFVERIQPVAITLPSGRSLTMLMSMEEMRGAPLHVGEFGRFAPHSNFEVGYPKEPDNPYWVAVGCIVELCAKSDAACQQGYHSAIYHLPDGQEMDATASHVLAGGITIDNQTMKQVHRSASKQ